MNRRQLLPMIQYKNLGLKLQVRIKSSETFGKYCEMVDEIQEKIDKQSFTVLEKQRRVACRKRNNLHFGILLPIE